MNKSLILNPKFLLLVIIIIAAFLRLYNITQFPPGLYPDEAMNGNNALESLSTGHFKVFYPENNGREGLFINIQAISIKLFGNEPWALRIVSAIFGILTVLGVYFLAKELFSEKIALLSAFLLATSFWHINFSRIGFRAIMAPFFITWALYFLLLTLNKIKELPAELGSINRTKGKYVLYSILGGIFLGLGFHSYIAFRAMPALILVVLFFNWLKHKESRKKLLLSTFCFLLFTILTTAPLGWYFLKNPGSFFGRTTQVSVFSSTAPLEDLGTNILKTAGMFNFIGDSNWRHNYAGRPELFWPVGIIFIIGLFLGLKMFFKKEYFQSFLILFSWLIIAALPVVVSNEGIPHALRSIIMIPSVFILAGFGGIWLYEMATKCEFFTNIRIKKITAGFILIFLSLLIFEAYYTYFIRWAQNPNVQGAFAADYAQIGYELRALPKEMPKYVIVEANGVDVRGIPMPAQTVTFLTDTFTPQKQKEKNLHYVLSKDVDEIPAGAYVIYIK